MNPIPLPDLATILYTCLSGPGAWPYIICHRVLIAATR